MTKAPTNTVTVKELAFLLQQDNVATGKTGSDAHVDTQTIYGWMKRDMPHYIVDGIKRANLEEVKEWLRTRQTRRSTPESLRRSWQTVTASINRTERLAAKLPAQRDKRAQIEENLRELGVPENLWSEPVPKS